MVPICTASGAEALASRVAAALNGRISLPLRIMIVAIVLICVLRPISHPFPLFRQVIPFVSKDTLVSGLMWHARAPKGLARVL